MKRRSQKKNVNVSEVAYDALSPANVREVVEEELEMALQERVVELTKDRKNAAEAYIYAMRNKACEAAMLNDPKFDHIKEEGIYYPLSLMTKPKPATPEQQQPKQLMVVQHNHQLMTSMPTLIHQRVVTLPTRSLWRRNSQRLVKALKLECRGVRIGKRVPLLRFFSPIPFLFEPK
ncbi:hypothetical protein Cgig2_016619 [Carnegiea gigantea]|uniref:Uncharacterized protein n=1 Tax=Carnegiea gigantea TaxID=171969 RepID=A0A9Q1QQY0_9CARY|nr:hypothetical protein Cgig2_016619 [Carnegiea gigantea]